MSKSIIAGAIVGFFLGISGNLIAAWIQQDILQDSFTPLKITIIFLLTIIGIVIGASLDKVQTKGTVFQDSSWKPPDITKRYDFKNIRILLTEGFSAQELRRLCYDMPEFRPVYDELTDNTGKSGIIDQLIEYADRKLLLDVLLNWAKEQNPTQYERYQPYYRPTITSAIARDVYYKGIYWIIPALVIGLIVVFGLLIILRGKYRTEPSTMYFVVDATDKMQPIFDEVRKQVQVAANEVREDSRIGLRVYGGDNNGVATCQDSRQLLKPSEYPEAQKLLDLVLVGVKPHSHSSMTGAILDALLSDLQKEDRPAKLILVTSGIDPLCDPPAGDFLKDRAKDIGRNVELSIFAIGTQDDNTRLILENYAKAFQGHFLEIPNAESLPPYVKSISFYGYGYGYPFYGQSATPEQ